MPLTVTLTEGVIPAGHEGATFVALAEAMLRAHGLDQNAAMRRNLVGSINVLPISATYANLAPTPLAFVEWKVPAVAFADHDVRKRYFEEATNIMRTRSQGRLKRDNIYINVVHAVDGAWNFDGQPMTNTEIGAALAP